MQALQDPRRQCGPTSSITPQTGLASPWGRLGERWLHQAEEQRYASTSGSTETTWHHVQRLISKSPLNRLSRDTQTLQCGHFQYIPSQRASPKHILLHSARHFNTYRLKARESIPEIMPGCNRIYKWPQSAFRSLWESCHTIHGQFQGWTVTVGVIQGVRGSSHRG